MKTEIKTEIVIASYMETLNWVGVFKCFNDNLGLLPSCKFTIYRTGNSMDGAFMLTNRGREAGQWLTHIVERYETLADVTFFVQADLGASFGVSGDIWPQDMNVIKQFRLPTGGREPFQSPVDDFSFRIWPNWDRVRCIVSEPKMTEQYNFGISLGHPEPTPPEVRLIWDKAPEKIQWPQGGNFLGAQHVLTRKFIHRLPRSYYEDILQKVRKHELAHWLEFGKWPTIIYDIFRQGPLKGSKRHENSRATRNQPSPAG